MLAKVATSGLVTLALEARSKAGIKVRQPLQKLEVVSVLLDGKEEFLDLIKDEVNVKEVVVVTDLSEPVLLHTEISAELKKEGSVRHPLRALTAPLLLRADVRDAARAPERVHKQAPVATHLRRQGLAELLDAHVARAKYA